MNEMQRRPEETVRDWLERLRGIDPERLPPRARLTWELSVGYARYLVEREGPDPCWLVALSKPGPGAMSV